MDVWLLDSKYDTIYVIDDYRSLIWNEKFQSCGDTELHLPARQELVDAVQQDLYLSMLDSPELMVVEEIEITRDKKDGKYMKVSGRSLSSILDRRVITTKTTLTGNFQNGIKKLLDENVISPSDSSRAIPNFSFKSSSDPYIQGLTIDTAFFGENLYSAIQTLCKEKKIGFRVLPNGRGGFEFELYNGTDRSYNQDLRPWVVFSPQYDNLVKSNFIESKKAYKNACLVVGNTFEIKDAETNEAISSGRYSTYVSSDSSKKGLERRETYVSFGSDDTTELQAKGNETLGKAQITKVFDGEINASIQFVYGVDFFLGDTVQVCDDYGREDAARVSEVIRSYDAKGESVTPSFTFSEAEVNLGGTT